ncbi:MAG: hypothetical protein NUW37_12665 [Planctomycetes bacterium]|nr:hypothetical protein [Planctomycetota bacterium]
MRHRSIMTLLSLALLICAATLARSQEAAGEGSTAGPSRMLGNPSNVDVDWDIILTLRSVRQSIELERYDRALSDLRILAQRVSRETLVLVEPADAASIYGAALFRPALEVIEELLLSLPAQVTRNLAISQESALQDALASSSDPIALESVVKRNPLAESSPSVLEKAALFHYETGDMHRAARVFRILMRRYPNHFGRRHYLFAFMADVYYRVGDYPALKYHLLPAVEKSYRDARIEIAGLGTIKLLDFVSERTLNVGQRDGTFGTPSKWSLPEGQRMSISSDLEFSSLGGATLTPLGGGIHTTGPKDTLHSVTMEHYRDEKYVQIVAGANPDAIRALGGGEAPSEADEPEPEQPEAIEEIPPELRGLPREILDRMLQDFARVRQMQNSARNRTPIIQRNNPQPSPLYRKTLPEGIELQLPEVFLGFGEENFDPDSCVLWSVGLKELASLLSSVRMEQREMYDPNYGIIRMNGYGYNQTNYNFAGVFPLFDEKSVFIPVPGGGFKVDLRSGKVETPMLPIMNGREWGDPNSPQGTAMTQYVRDPNFPVGACLDEGNLYANLYLRSRNYNIYGGGTTMSNLIGFDTSRDGAIVFDNLFVDVFTDLRESNSLFRDPRFQSIYGFNPLIYGNGVYVTSVGMGNERPVSVCKMDKTEIGEDCLKWITTVSSSFSRSSPWRPSNESPRIPDPPVQYEGLILVSSNAGSIAGVDIDTGDVAWVTLYHLPKTQQTQDLWRYNAPKTYYFDSVSQVEIGEFCVAPRDSDRIFFFEAGTGRLLHFYPPTRFEDSLPAEYDHFLGASNQKAYISSGTTIEQIDVRFENVLDESTTIELDRFKTAGNFSITGRGLFTPDYMYLPCTYGVLKIRRGKMFGIEEPTLIRLPHTSRDSAQIQADRMSSSPGSARSDFFENIFYLPEDSESTDTSQERQIDGYRYRSYRVPGNLSITNLGDGRKVLIVADSRVTAYLVE